MITVQNRVTVRGQWFAFVITGLLTGVAGYFGYRAQDWLAGTIFTTAIAAVATVFLQGGTHRTASWTRRLLHDKPDFFAAR
jgi:hypothetical protein